MSERARVAIVGGGISGLATAHALRGKDLDVVLFEASDRLGGNVRTVRRDGYVLDEGPDSWVSQKPQVTTLAKSLGLGDHLVETLPENRRVYVRLGRELAPLPEGLVLGIPTQLLPLITTPLISWRGKLRAGLDLVLPVGFGREPGEDESLGAFIERRVGREVLDTLVAPLLGGLFTGDVSALSLLGTFPQIAALEKQGGLIRGALAQAKKAPKRAPGVKPSGFTSLLHGMGELVDALANELGDVVRRATPVTRVTRLDGRFEVEAASSTSTFDHVVVTGPTHVAAALLRPVSAPLADELAAIEYGSAATVFFAHDRKDVPHPLDATGYLVPKRADEHVLASTWVSSKWPNRAPAGKVLLRVFFGAKDVDKTDDALAALAREELREVMNVTAAPEFVHVARFRRASPQPLVGHPQRLARIAAARDEVFGLHLAGSAYDGVGLGDCVRQAEQIAARIAGRPRFVG